MNIVKNEPLSRHTTLRVGGPAQFFLEARTEDHIREAVKFAKKNKLPIFILGGGSNLLVSDNGFPGLVIKVSTRGISISHSPSPAHRPSPIATDDEQRTTLNPQPSTIHISAEAGEPWDALVACSVRRALYGLENMSLIPGTVGGAVIGNIGAYGAEIKDTLIAAEALETRTGLLRRFTAADCQFAYRHSFFKTPEGRNYILLRATFALTKDPVPNLAYKDLQDYFSPSTLNPQPSTHSIRDAVIAIRQRKLPDPDHIGTAGSFFKNPIIPKTQYDALAKRYPGLPGHPEPNNLIKIPLGWVLDKICGLKGARQGSVGTHPGQALVLINDGGTASDIETFANRLARAVKEKTGLDIQWEVERV